MSAIEKKLDEVISFINDSREKLQEGLVVSLDDFQNDVAKLCQEIANQPVTEMKPLTDKLNNFSDLLQKLEDELRAQQHLVQREIFALNRKQQALKSYETASHSDKKEEE